MKIIALTQGKTAIVDDVDYESLNKYKWCATKCGHTWYACRGHRLPNGREDTILMHRQILGLQKGDNCVSDHINHNGLDNRRLNLRICTQSQNHMNRRKTTGSSKFKGVSFHQSTSKWQAMIKDPQTHKNINLGGFTSEIDAAGAYNEAAKKLFGEFSNINKF